MGAAAGCLLRRSSLPTVSVPRPR
uniref:Uncharacterized protein n=1 Tax=Arundo donax TaxID=35708 RepID=A0A0A9BD27_ARUDO